MKETRELSKDILKLKNKAYATNLNGTLYIRYMNLRI